MNETACGSAASSPQPCLQRLLRSDRTQQVFPAFRLGPMCGKRPGAHGHKADEEAGEGA